MKPFLRILLIPWILAWFIGYALLAGAHEVLSYYNITPIKDAKALWRTVSTYIKTGNWPKS